MAKYRKRYPSVHFRLREAHASQLHDALHDGELDLGIVTGKGDEHWMWDQLILVASPKLDDKNPGFLTFTEGSSTRELLLRHFPKAEIVMELSSIATVKGNVRAGIGIALVSRAAVDADISAGRLVEIPSKKTPIRRQLSLVHRGVDRLPPAAARLRTLLLDKSASVGRRRSTS